MVEGQLPSAIAGSQIAGEASESGKGCGNPSRGHGGKLFPERCANGGEEIQDYPAACELLQQHRAKCGEDKIRAPDPEEGRDLAGFREGYADVRDEVVSEDKQKGENEAGGLAAALGGQAKRDADEH